MELEIKAEVVQLVISRIKCSRRLLIDSQSGSKLARFQDAIWSVAWETVEKEDSREITARFELVKGFSNNTITGLVIIIPKWSADNYVLLPAAAYNGNRFKSRKLKYPPQLEGDYDSGPYTPPIITDVPRLSMNQGKSQIQLMAGDLSTPAIGFRDTAERRGFLLLTPQSTNHGNSSISIRENKNRDSASISVHAPGVRQINKYAICDTSVLSVDKGVDFKQGDTVSIRIRIYEFACTNIQALFNKFAMVRKDVTGPVELKHELPLSCAWKIIEEKYNKSNWEDEHGYYSVGLRENIYQDWQIGWVGGMMCTYPFLYEGSDLSKYRTRRNFDFIFRHGQDKSGFFFGCGHNGQWFGDNFKNPEMKWHLVRKSGDALYFMLKQMLILQLIEPTSEIPDFWLTAIKKCADAFVRLWRQHKQFGQFVDSGSGDIIIGGSSSAATAPAGLALASAFFGDAEYLDVAIESMHHYFDAYVRKGFTTGGPGEICQCPDSESAFGLLESMVALYEATGSRDWIDKASDMANQCFSWCVSYDYQFPSLSTFGGLDMKTTGSVYANVQNKHAAPGICTLSGVSLLKLFRATGDKKYLELLQEITHNMTQYLSREDRPIPAVDGRIMPPGWMNERVEMSDWLEPVGEVFFGSCWCEVSTMLSFTEVPGVYVQPDTGLVCAIDHVNAEIMENSGTEILLRLANPTRYDAEIKLLCESSDQMVYPLGPLPQMKYKKVYIPAKSDICQTIVKGVTRESEEQCSCT